MVGKLIAVLMALLLGCSAATQVFAYLARLDPVLGRPLWHQSVLAVYAPWQVVGWCWAWCGRVGWAFQAPVLLGMVVSVIVLVQAWPRSQPTRGRRWATGGDLRRAQCTGTRGVVLAKRWRGLWWQVLRYVGEGHLLFVGGTGKGKTVTLISTLLEEDERSVFLYEPKDAVYAKTAGRRRQMGHKVIRLAPMAADTDFLNPWDLVRLGTDDEWGDACLIAEHLTDLDGKGAEDSTSQHFRELVNQCLGGVSLYGLHSGIATTGAAFDALLNAGGQQGWEDLLTVMTHDAHPLVQRAAGVLSKIKDRELSSLQTTLARALSVFVDPRVAHMTSQSSLTLRDFREAAQPCTIYLSVPFRHLARLRPLLRTIIQQFLGHATSRVGGWAHDVLAIFDEAPSAKHLSLMTEGLNFVREYGVQLLLLTPSMQEFYQNYGPYTNILEGTQVKLCFGTEDLEVAAKLARKVGTTTVQRQRVTRTQGRRSVSQEDHQEALITEEEVSHLPTGQVLLVTDQCSAVLRQARYFNNRAWRQASAIPVS